MGLFGGSSSFQEKHRESVGSLPDEIEKGRQELLDEKSAHQSQIRFAVLCDRYPESSEAWEGLGDATMKIIELNSRAGDETKKSPHVWQAIENYDKAIQLYDADMAGKSYRGSGGSDDDRKRRRELEDKRNVALDLEAVLHHEGDGHLVKSSEKRADACLEAAKELLGGYKSHEAHVRSELDTALGLYLFAKERAREVAAFKGLKTSADVARIDEKITAVIDLKAGLTMQNWKK